MEVATGSLRRPSGNSPVALEPRLLTIRENQVLNWRRLAGIPGTRQDVPMLWENWQPMHSVSLICMGTCWNGARTAWINPAIGSMNYSQPSILDIRGAMIKSVCSEADVLQTRPRQCRSATRDCNFPKYRTGMQGFRAALSIDAVRQTLKSNTSTAWYGRPGNFPKLANTPFVAAQANRHQAEWAEYLNLPVIVDAVNQSL